ncbi:PP2C family protein-serine/threonine phosphatase [Rhabdochlamydiaceae symbiont of Dictyostelium giganteum]|uniref:PP2C family protein-serine/threonine phosphatase n=1 Tax=Rhabdochlamydiaceae symbiont of Dictyostelium giganteum TaxID=3342349 RepID=UPI00384BC248
MKFKMPSIETFGISDIGLSRENNEDVWGELFDDRFYVLADGMGGHLAGEVAAKEAVLHFCDAIDKYFRDLTPPTISSAKRYLGETFISANSWIRRLGKDHPDLHGMGTTLCSLLILEDHIIIGHVGDSRIYQFRNSLSLLTNDHSLERRLIEKAKQGRPCHPCKHILTKALGIHSIIEPDLAETPYAVGDIYMLCSDGLHDAISDHQMEMIFKKNLPLKELAIQLVDLAKEEKGDDNITLLLIRIGNP